MSEVVYDVTCCGQMHGKDEDESVPMQKLYNGKIS